MVLRTIAMAMGIIAGTLELAIGLFSYFLDTDGLAILLMLVSAITGVMGAVRVRNKPLKGSIWMASAGIVLILALFLSTNKNSVLMMPPSSLYTLNYRLRPFYLSPLAALFIVGAILGWQSNNQSR